MKTFNKKAVLFSLLALLLAGLVFFVVTPTHDSGVGKSTHIASLRIQTLDSFMEQLDAYFADAVKTATPNAMDALAEEVAANGFLNQTELQQRYQQYAQNGYAWEFTLDKTEVSDIGFTLNSGLSPPQAYASTDVLFTIGGMRQLLYARNATLLRNIQFRVASFAGGGIPVLLEVYVFSDDKGMLGHVVDYANLSYTTVPVIDTVTLNFSRNYRTSEGEPLYVLFVNNASSGTFFYVEDDFVAESNVTSSPVIRRNATFMENRSVEVWGEKLQTYVNDTYGNRFQYAVHGMDIWQEDPWHLKVRMNLTYFLEDAFASWQKQSIFITEVPIEGMRDPQAAAFGGLGTQRRFSRSAAYKGIYDLKPGDNGNIVLFEDYYNNSYSIPSARAPSMLMRYVNNTNASLCCGLESLVNNSYPARENASSIDFRYFDQSKSYSCTLGELWNMTNDPAGIYGTFRLDRESVAYYGYGEEGDPVFSEAGCS